MPLTLQLRKQTKFKVVQSSKEFKLELEVLDPENASVYVNKKYMDLGTFSFNKDKILFTREVEKGSEIYVKDFEKVGKTKRQKT